MKFAKLNPSLKLHLALQLVAKCSELVKLNPSKTAANLKFAKLCPRKIKVFYSILKKDSIFDMVLTHTCTHTDTHTHALFLGIPMIILPLKVLSTVNWEKNRNFFDFWRHGDEIRFSNYRLRHFGKVEAIWGQNGTLDEIDRVGISDNSTPSDAT